MSPDGRPSHLSTLNKVCANEWSKITDNIKQCIIGSSPVETRQRQWRHVNITGSSQSLPLLHHDKDTVSVSSTITGPERKTSDGPMLRRSLSANAERSHRLHPPSNGAIGAMMDVLTPFQALAGIKRELPAYWISFAYVYNPKLQQLNMTLRQTGVLPNTVNPASKLIMVVSCYDRKNSSKRKMKKVTLRESKTDMSFRSNKLNFYVSNKADVRDYCARFRIYSSTLLQKKKLADWEMTLSDCSFSGEKSHLTKVEFIK